MSSPFSHAVSPLLQLPNTFRAFYGAFSHLHAVQKQAIEPLLLGRDLILQSATGSGKTEAVLAPCIERVMQSGRAMAVVYVVPTRALAVDLERRLKPVMDRLHLRLSVRTGDFKRAGGTRPDLLVTTPESLDVTLGSANADLRQFVQRIGTVIIDEVHPLIHTYRGRQLACLLRRIDRRADGVVQKVALSATIADVGAVIAFLGFQSDAVRLVEPVQRTVVPHLVHLKNDMDELVALMDDLYEHWHYQKVLLFANSRSLCDRLFSLFNHHGRFQGVTELHYSNLKPKERQGTESRFRKRTHALCIATSTLELGIDVGDVDGVVLFEPPDSASAFLQRIGRANRREDRTHFWGICRGETAQAQLLRFLGLLRLAHQGVVESLPHRTLPSVLVQQTLSCLYEKKRLSLSALCHLFPEQREILARLFAAMVQQGWLREDRIVGLFRGGWRYRDCFLDRRIWSNFPESEEAYTLEFAGEAIADLPTSVVRQLELGDRVPLVGKRLLIEKIETEGRKRVVARPVTHLDEKDIFWLGAGFRVSYEVAQSIREVLAEGHEPVDGVFARTKKLLKAALDRVKNTVVLDNGIEVGRTPGGLYGYRTYLGSVGNLMLQWAIEKALREQDGDLVVLSNEVGVDCSHWIEFEKLDLPTNRDAFCQWAEGHLDALCGLFSLNAFASVLPRELLVEEVVDFLFDPRIAAVFQGYVSRSSQVVLGDLAMLDQMAVGEEPVLLDIASEAIPLLDWEKQRWKAAVSAGNLAEHMPREDRLFVRYPNVEHQPRPLNGTMVGSYIRHQQCARWLSSNFLPPSHRPSGWAEAETDVTTLRMAQGTVHEQRVMDHILASGTNLIVVTQTDESGQQRSMKARFETTVAHLKSLVQAVIATPDQSFVLSQAVLLLPSVLEQKKTWLSQVGGIGISDLIRISMTDLGPQLTVGDIKDSLLPHEGQKWQVAFYVYLLHALIQRGVLSDSVGVSDAGFLMLRPSEDGFEPHEFDVRPYLAAFPMMLENMDRVLEKTSGDAAYRLQSHCATCANFSVCYREALEGEDIQFLPQISVGALQKFRVLGIKTLLEADAYFEHKEASALFSPHQRARLTARLSAMRTHQIGLQQQKTRLFPNNVSTAMFIHLIEDPITGLPRCVGWQILKGNAVVDTRTWTVACEEDLPNILQVFTAHFLKVWQESVGGGQGPHVFYFGSRCWQIFQAWAEKTDLAFLWMPGRLHQTDLRQLIVAHFDVPAPGTLTLFALCHLLRLKPAIDAPESLFHSDSVPYISPEDWMSNEEHRRATSHYLEAVLTLHVEIWKWVSLHLESAWQQRSWDVASDLTASPQQAFVHFLEEEWRLREEDVLTLQTYPLRERVERFRAMGPLRFLEATLDDEGRFLYGFQAELEAGLSKFRAGDFLKIAPVGLANLQDGLPIVLADHDRQTGKLWVQSRRGRLALNRKMAYSLEEDLTDWNGPKLQHGVQTVFDADRPHVLTRLFSGQWSQDRDPDALSWAQNWLQKEGKISGLNATQQQALLLPFHNRLSLVEGPPGTGKTHLLGWMVIALIRYAQAMGVPLRLVVSALTHQAIDQVLLKVMGLVNRYNLSDFPGKCLKWGRQVGDAQVEALRDVDALADTPYAILGATGFGLYQMFEGQKGRFPQVFDWVIFDEASQVLIPQALLSLLYGKGHFLFSGDVKQLPPVVLGTYEVPFDAQRSVLAQLLAAYGSTHRIRLDETYRLNADLCAFPSKTWYDGVLHAAPENANRRLELMDFQNEDFVDGVLHPDKPVTLVLTDHFGCHQQSDAEVDIVSQLAHRLMMRYGLRADQLALISPHRAQNNAIADRLVKLLGQAELPLIDTVERVQGAERDVIVFAFTTSDPDYITSVFLNNPNRFNVAITRAKKKLIVVGSRAFFFAIPQTEDALMANQCFKSFYAFCKERHSLFIWEYAYVPKYG